MDAEKYDSFCKECNGEVIESKTLNECDNHQWRPGYAKIPVVLGEFTVQVDVEAKIKLEEPAIEIKRIKKNVFLTQCRFIAGTDKLFLSGFVRKNIEFATKKCVTESAISGDIKDTTVFIPFHCVTKVRLDRYPVLFENGITSETEYLDKKSTGKDINEKDLADFENFNEKIFCELVSAQIFEADIDNDSEFIKEFPKEHEFQTFTEKMVIYITLKLLQKQQVYYFLSKQDVESEPDGRRKVPIKGRKIEKPDLK